LVSNNRFFGQKLWIVTSHHCNSCCIYCWKINYPQTLGVVASMLAVVCKCMQQLPTMLGPTVHCGKDTTHKMCVAPTMLEELCKWIQQCCATLQWSRNKRNVGSCWLCATTRNNMQGCANWCNITSVCTGLL